MLRFVRYAPRDDLRDAAILAGQVQRQQHGKRAEEGYTFSGPTEDSQGFFDALLIKKVIKFRLGDGVA
jgi:hypothetical protein